jgi:hypothetical protein
MRGAEVADLQARQGSPSPTTCIAAVCRQKQLWNQPAKLYLFFIFCLVFLYVFFMKASSAPWFFD